MIIIKLTVSVDCRYHQNQPSSHCQCLGYL